jgi:hypothetical protein
MELEDGRYVLSFFSLTRARETTKINRKPIGHCAPLSPSRVQKGDVAFKVFEQWPSQIVGSEPIRPKKDTHVRDLASRAAGTRPREDCHRPALTLRSSRPIREPPLRFVACLFRGKNAVAGR